MSNTIQSAIEDISYIKEVMERTKYDFSKAAIFFLWIGFINIIAFILEQITYFIRNTSGYSSDLYNLSAILTQIFLLIAYIFCFFIYYRKIKKRNNDISTGIIKVWGIVLISSQIFSFVYIFILPNVVNDVFNTLFRCKELIIILPVLVVLFMTAIFTNHKTITIITAVVSIIYLFMFTSLKEIPYGTIGGIGTRISMSSAMIKLIMTLGMILLSIYLKKGKRRWR